MTKKRFMEYFAGVPGVFNAVRYFEYHQYPGDEIQLEIGFLRRSMHAVFTLLFSTLLIFVATKKERNKETKKE